MTTDQQKPPPKRFTMDDLEDKRPPRPSRFSVLEKVIDKLTGKQLFWLIVLTIVAYTILNWTK